MAPRILPIPAALLPDSMAVSVPDETPGYGGRFMDPVEVANVRYERAESLDPTAYRLAEGASGRIWMDARNSPGAFRIPAGSKIELGGDVLYAVACSEYRPFGEVHHWEVDVR